MRALLLLVSLCFGGCASPKRITPPMPPKMASKAVKDLAPVPFAANNYRIVWDENVGQSVVYVVDYTTDFTNWVNAGETEGTEFPIVADRPFLFYRVGARWK